MQLSTGALEPGESDYSHVFCAKNTSFQKASQLHPWALSKTQRYFFYPSGPLSIKSVALRSKDLFTPAEGGYKGVHLGTDRYISAWLWLVVNLRDY